MRLADHGHLVEHEQRRAVERGVLAEDEVGGGELVRLDLDRPGEDLPLGRVGLGGQLLLELVELRPDLLLRLSR
jgi:hypothetical protein